MGIEARAHLFGDYSLSVMGVSEGQGGHPETHNDDH
jgi:hypothetical protein